jgi:hypothetical protein
MVKQAKLEAGFEEKVGPVDGREFGCFGIEVNE